MILAQTERPLVQANQFYPSLTKIHIPLTLLMDENKCGNLRVEVNSLVQSNFTKLKRESAINSL